MLKKLCAVTLLLAAMPARAVDVEVRPGSTQDNFASMSRDIIATLSYKALEPAEATGIKGIAVGVFGSYVTVADEAAWRNVTGQQVDALGLAGIAVSKGLPLNLDVGGFYTFVPNTNVKVYGAQVRYAILPGSTTTPAVAVRGNYSRAAGIRNFDADAFGVDVSVSKGFTISTPYAGVGYVWGVSDPKGAFGLRKVNVNELRLFAGMRLSFGFFDLIPEYERIGDNNALSLKLGFSI